MAAILKSAAAAAALALLSACASSAAPEIAYPQSVVAGDLRFDALTPQPLEAGRCGLYIWGQSLQQPVFVLAAYNTPAEAHVRINGRDRVLPRVSFDGAPTSGHFEEQVFAAGDVSVTLDVTFDANRPLRDGAAIRQGVMRVRDAQGWETIVPIGGLLACAN